MIKLVVLLSTLVSPLASAEILTGVAKNRAGDIVYIEKHQIQRDESGLNKFIRVDYSKPDGSLFATMTSDFSNHKSIPETIYTDMRFNSKATIRVVGDSVEFEEFKNDKRLVKKTLPLSKTMVASQGFDNFLKVNSEKLASKPVEFKFGVLEKKDFYSLTGYRRPSSSNDHVEYGIRASSWIARIFAEELRVVYDSKRMRLKSFAGRSNVLDESGKAQDVVIDYQWAEKS